MHFMFEKWRVMPHCSIEPCTEYAGKVFVGTPLERYNNQIELRVAI